MTLKSLLSFTPIPIRRSALLAGWMCFLFAGFACIGFSATLPSGFNEQQIASGLTGPTQMEIAPDGRIFICEEGGRLRVVKNGSLLGTPFLTVTTDTNGERGLLGVAFDPNFATNRWVYVYYTSPSGSIHNRISRFRASTSNPDVVEAGSEQVLMDLPPVGSAIYHNGGAIHFGGDGKLYIAVGDHRTPNNAPSLTSVFGKILRINPDGTIPTDNPFYGSTSGNNRAIWARGLRNPFNFGFNPSNGDMLINDVGEGTWEEINDGVPGANYGWPSTEGSTTNPSFVSPLYVYNHSSGQCSIVAGCFYSPTNVQFPSTYVGRYFFGDYCAGWMRVLNPATGTASNFGTGFSGLVDTKTANDGSLYYLQRGSGSNTGALYRVTYGSGSQPPTITQHPQSQSVGNGQSVTFNVATSGTPPFTYQWQRNNTNISGATSQSYTRVAATADNGSTYRVVVSNSVGSATSNNATLTVTGTAPVPTITAPAVGSTVAGGDIITYSGTATDAEDGTLPASAFTWWADQHHDSHTHPLMAPTTGSMSGSFEFPAANEVAHTIFVRIYLRVRDSSGAETVTSRDIQPRKIQMTLNTIPAGRNLTLDGLTVATPLTITAVEGVIRALGAPDQSAGGQTFTFQSWSDGGAQTHNINTPATSTTYTATFAVTTPTTLTWETESLTRTSSGATTAPQTDANNSGGTWIALQADGAGDYVDYTLPNVPAGTYQLKMRYKGHPARGILNLRVDGTQVGGTLDQYSSTPVYPEHTFGSVTFATAGNHTVRLTVTGRNTAATAFTLSSDTFTLVATTATVATPTFSPGGGTYATAQNVTISTTTPDASIRYTTDGSTPTTTTGTVYTGPVTVSTTATLRAIAYKSGLTNSAVAAATYTIGSVPTPIVVEAEALSRTSTGATTAPQTDANNSGGTWIALQADGVGDYVEYTLTNVPAGTYQVKMMYKGHPNRGILNLRVDGTQIGTTLDQYSATSIYPERTFGTVTFATAGNHVIRLTVTGRNSAAGAFTLSADRFSLTP
jgi:glucose/arabinose dehydrogenase